MSDRETPFTYNFPFFLNLDQQLSILPLLEHMRSYGEQIQSWSCSLGFGLAHFTRRDQDQDMAMIARPSPRQRAQDQDQNPD